MVAILFLTAASPLSAPWWIGVASCLVATLSRASGFLAAAAVLILISVVGWRQIGPTDPEIVAQAPGEFLAALGRCLAWPNDGRPELAPLAWFPIVVLARAFASRPQDRTRLASFVLGLGCWAGLQAAGVAYSRGRMAGDIPYSRYQDLLALGAFANAAALVLLLATSGGPARPATPLRMLALVWWITLAVGLGWRTKQNILEHLPERARIYAIQRANVRAFLLSDDKRDLADTRWLAIPYPDSDRLAEMLRHPRLRPLFPAPPEATRGSAIETFTGLGGRLAGAGLQLLLGGSLLAGRLVSLPGPHRRE
jgi:hypothetical protein